jgi:hypothetical protein
MSFIIITGDPLKGFNFTGPFLTEGEAIDYAERDRKLDYSFWQCTGLLAPNPAESNISISDAHLINYLSRSMKDKVLIHKDGDCHNYDITNLTLVSKEDPFELVSQETLDEIREELDKNDSLPGTISAEDDLDIPF